MVTRLAIMASGSGTNAQRIMEYFASHTKIRVELVLCNNPKAMVIERAAKMKVPVFLFSHHDLYETSHVLDTLSVQGIDWIILAGFLWLIPRPILSAYPGAIINIHPALLPKYGGKGMYGMRVHQTVISNGDRESGITIHYLNEHYDEGQVIFQARCPVMPNDSPEMLASRIHELEYEHFPVVIEKIVGSG
ncbi:MAG: phosphoribosylglycinamide formyltransferase [bacterium]